MTWDLYVAGMLFDEIKHDALRVPVRVSHAEADDLRSIGYVVTPSADNTTIIEHGTAPLGAGLKRYKNERHR